MKIIFAGTAIFAVPSLQKLIKWCEYTSHELIAVYTQPDRPSGRGKQIQSSSIKTLAINNQIPVYQPDNLKTQDAFDTLQRLQPDLMIVVAYGLLIPPKILRIPKLGCINVHASLLPRWRGASPIQQAILAGDECTGITIIQMDAGLDTGNILYQEQENILFKDTSSSLQDRLAKRGANCLLTTLADLPEQQAMAQSQATEGACYAPKIKKEDALINWNEPASSLIRRIRAFNPWPISFTLFQGQKLRVWSASSVSMEQNNLQKPGCIIDISKQGVLVATGEDLLNLTHLQFPGGRCLEVSSLLNGQLKDLKVGMCFENSI